MKSKGKLMLIMLLAAFLFVPDNVFAQCTNCLHATSSPEQVSSALGDRTKAIGYASFASGFNAIANGDQSTSIGIHSTADGLHSFTFGSNASSIADQSMIIGHGFGISQADRLINDKDNSLMIGFNSIYPTLFVSPATSKTRTGRVGIGNVTDPQAKLHIRADQGEQASLFLEQANFRNADLLMGNLHHGIRSSDDHGLEFRTAKNYIFNEGNIGINSSYPEYDLEVQGSTFSKHFTLFDPEAYKESIEGWVLRSNGEGHAYWTDPSLLSDNDWVVKEDNVYRNTGNVGIGTSSPVAQLEIADIFPAGGLNLKIGNDAYFTDVDKGHTLGLYSFSNPEYGALKLGSTGPELFGNNKNLGIGTSNPSTTLELQKNLNSGGTLGICLANAETERWFIGLNGDQQNVHDLLIGNFDNLHIGYSSFMVLKSNGNLGLGTKETYGYRLAVNGAIITEEVMVKTKENWPDFVFTEDYELLSLAELSHYIDQHKHLPGIPSAKEVQKEGLNVGEMEGLLLQKIEELSLYIIAQESRIQQIEGQLEQLIY